MNRAFKKQILSAFILALALFALLPLQLAIANDGLLNGNWQGDWQSCTTGHRGRMQASFCRIDAQHVQANFKGTFAKVIPFRYRPVLNIVHEEPGMMVLEGSKRLPLMGEFRYNAVISGSHFDATYSSRRDHGRWQMTR